MKIRERLAQQYDGYVARRVAMDVLEMTKEELVVDSGNFIDSRDLKVMDSMMERCQSGEPLAYVLGYEVFCGERFVVDERVLIPRSETEELVALVAESGKLKAENSLLVDMGTGSGCVGLSIAKRLKKVEEGGRRLKKVVLCDVSEGALEVARKNVKILMKSDEIGGNLMKSPGQGGQRGFGEKTDNIEIPPTPLYQGGDEMVITKQVDVMRLVDDDQGLDEVLEKVDNVVIVANLPYIPDDYEGVEDDVQEWEPHLALYSGADGLDHYRALLRWAKPGWTVRMEMMTDQVDILMKSDEIGGGQMKVYQTLHPNIVMVEMSCKQ